MYVETGRFLRADDARRADRRRPDRGARASPTPAEIAALPERLVFNCTGLGARELFGDTELRPVARPARHPAAPARGPLRLHRRGRLHVPARRRHHARRHVRAATSGRPSRSRRRSPASSPRTSACSAASAAPLELARCAPNLAADELPAHSRRQPGPRAQPTARAAGSMNDNLTPKAVVAALDEHIVGQDDAKRAVAVALRNRWRRQRLPDELREEVTPKNILMIGPTGCGKTEISRRLAKLADAPFVKVEATKFTEVGYVGRDVEQIARDLVEEAVRLEKERRPRRGQGRGRGRGDGAAARRADRQGRQRGDPRELPAALPRRPSRRLARSRSSVVETPNTPFEIPGMGGQVGMINLSEMMSQGARPAAAQAPQAEGRARPGPGWSRRKRTRGSIPTTSTASRSPTPRRTASSSSTRSTRSRSPTCAAARSAARASSATCCR